MGPSRRNPLDPYAFDYTTDPFIIHGRRTERDLHLGVHTATEPEPAAIYAVHRAMVSGGVPVVLHLDVSGLEPLPDRDAILGTLARLRSWPAPPYFSLDFLGIV
jgi:hypothetical protein